MVFAGRSFKPKQLKLVPECFGLKLSDGATEGRFVCRLKDNGMSFVLQNPGLKKATVPAFLVARAAKNEEANMATALFKAVVAAGAKATSYVVEVEYLHNTTDLNDGDALLLPPVVDSASREAVSHKRKHVGIILADSDATSSKGRKTAE